MSTSPVASRQLSAIPEISISVPLALASCDGLTLGSFLVLRKKGGCKLPRCKLQGKLPVIYITYRCRPNCRVRNVDNAAKISHTRQSQNSVKGEGVDGCCTQIQIVVCSGDRPHELTPRRAGSQIFPVVSYFSYPFLLFLTLLTVI